MVAAIGCITQGASTVKTGDRNCQTRLILHSSCGLATKTTIIRGSFVTVVRFNGQRIVNKHRSGTHKHFPTATTRVSSTCQRNASVVMSSSSSSTETLTKVFVYGTLKREQPNHFWFWKPQSGFARFISTGRTVTKFPMLIGTRYNVPFLLNRSGVGHCIDGEVYEIDQLMLNNLDVLEDYPLLYDRERHAVTLENGRTMECWLYLLRQFPESMLDKELISNYRNSDEHPYLERSKRLPNIRAIDDLDYVHGSTSQ